MSVLGHAASYGEPWRHDGPFGDVYGIEGNKVAKTPGPVKALRVAACVNACAGLPDPEKDVAEMREILREVAKCHTTRAEDDAVRELARAILVRTAPKDATP